MLGTLERDDGLDHLQRGGRGARRLARAARAGEGARRARLGAAPRPQADRAREPLRRALELADACGAAGLAEDVRGRAQALANETRDKLSAEAEERRKALEGQLNLKLAEAEKTIATTKTAAMANVRGIAVDTATAIVERLIGTAPSGSAVEAAVADALKR